jgi:hypothetical protein
MLTISLSLNILVLLPVVAGLIGDATWARAAFGVRSPARGILTSVYLAILIASIALLALNFTVPDRAAGPAIGLLTVQVIYKVLSPFLVGDAGHPVVRSNLAIAAVHTLTLIRPHPHYVVVAEPRPTDLPNVTRHV